MTEDVKKILIISICLVCLIGLLLVVFFVDIDLKVVKFSSISSLLAKHDEISQEEDKLTLKELEYNNAVKKVKEAQTSFDSEKAKYNSISDDTINIIKEATTEENYNIEYMWIRLGNYAKANNLTIIMAEPGGSFETESANKDGSEENTATTNSTTNSTTSSDTTSTTTNKNSTTTKSTDTTTTDEADGENNTTKQAKNTTAQTAANTTETKDTSANTIFKIQVSGSYLDVSDFIFEVENDKALRFKLDNISMDYVSGTTIKATFDVKNLLISK